MEQPPITDWFASIYRQSEATSPWCSTWCGRTGKSPPTSWVIVADVTDEATRFFVDQLGDGPTDPAMPGFVGAIPKATVARVLRMLDAPFADDAEKPVEDGLMRLLVAARGQMQCADIPAFPPMSPGGSA